MVWERLITKLWMAVTVCTVLTVSCALDTTPDAGTLDAVYANSSEELQVLSLGQGQTLGLLLGGIV